MTCEDGRVPLAPGSSPSGQAPTGLDASRVDPSREIFSYTDEQDYNIYMKLHPDCCQADPCAFCGASVAPNGKGCGGDLAGLALELFEEACCSARNANVKSIGQIVNWQVHDRHARAFDAAARFVAAQGMETGTAETEGLGAKPDSPVAESDAPEHPRSQPQEGNRG